uniref:Fucolectin tachylectin-4 pentraxin-1 domain-containing protein n=1 Tax=Leptobrachium leishanense TaxID=445787 RepID=A0A8C5QZ94_9ANUR
CKVTAQLLTSVTIYTVHKGVYSQSVNLALRGTSSQSSTYNELGAAENAIDGSSSANYMSKHCSHTAQDAPPWWRLDLTKVYNVQRVKVTNREDCCSERINGAEIRIGEGDARKAIDGYLNNDAAGDQCAKTKEEPDPWWKLDLNSDHKILSIAVTSRGECCDAPIKGAEIRVGNSNTSWKENPVCGTISSMDPGQTVSFYCNGMVGRFVYIVIPDDTRSLSLCEVQVFGVPTDKPIVNLALRGTSSQSSTYNHLGAAKNAIDGSRSTNYMSKHCSHTAQDAPPWWRLDLTKVYNVTRVKVTNRGDCCSERIDGAEIRIGLSPEHGGTKNPKCAKITSLGLGEEEEYICGMVGQYVTVTIPDRPEYLTLCEVKVYGEEVIGNYTGTSSTYDYLGAAENAIDGSRSTNYMSGHCTHTAQDAPPWWRLDLTKVYNVTRVKVTNRGDCCSERIDGAEIRIGSSPEHGGIKNPNLYIRPGNASDKLTHFLENVIPLVLTYRVRCVR